jgi:predicted transposase YbfD/YdcC
VRLALKGAQVEIATAMLGRGGDYLLALKANRPATFNDVETFFADSAPDGIETSTTTDGDHGRIDVRRHAVRHDVAWLFSDRRYPGEVAYPGLGMIGMVEGETLLDGKARREPRYYLCSAKLDAATSAHAVRGQWGIENRLHRVSDGVFKEDQGRLRSDHAPVNVALVRHMATNLLHQAKPTTSLKNSTKRAG